MPTPDDRSASAHPAAQSFLHAHVKAGHWPEGAYAFGLPGTEPRWSGGTPAGADGLFDLASLTKGLFTALVACRLAARGTISLDQDLAALLPEMRGYGGRTPSLRDLLSHDAGLRAWAPLYQISEQSDQVVEAISRLAPDRPAGSGPVYSCLGPILAGFVLERASGRDLRELLVEEVKKPLGIHDGDLSFAPVSDEHLPRVIATERGRHREAELAAVWSGGPASTPPPGSGTEEAIRGQAHDGNANFLGGAAGNAGLFASARTVFTIASAISADEEFLPESLRRDLMTSCARGGGEVRTVGFQSGEASAAPTGALGPESCGHVGFTGTSVWISHGGGPIAVLLTNRVSPRWREAPMQQWRREFHDIVAGQAS